MIEQNPFDSMDRNEDAAQMHSSVYLLHARISNSQSIAFVVDLVIGHACWLHTARANHFCFNFAGNRRRLIR